ncbi:hypothetical protein METBIDRAFT_21709, partial [Metschnikowia bicuspidata var. bicuspidata NRRL YB-4993]
DELPWSIHAQGLKSCLVAIRCDGPIILHDVENLVLILECHQLRIHNMRNCQVYALVANDRVIIEDSRDLIFLGFSEDALGPPCFVVDDFDWPTSETVNPHFKMKTFSDD